MMKLSKLLGIAVLTLATLGKVYSSDVVLEFRPNDNYFVQCSDNSRLFTNTEELSSRMNSVTSPYLCITSVEKSDNIVTFNGIHNENNIPYNLILQGRNGVIPKLVFNGRNDVFRVNNMTFDNIVSLDMNNMSRFKITGSFNCVTPVTVNLNDARLDIGTGVEPFVIPPIMHLNVHRL